MATNEPEPAPITVHEWLERVRSALASDADLSLSAAERRLLLDLARISARASERVAAPLTTYLVGIALAGLSSNERADRLAEVIRLLEAER